MTSAPPCSATSSTTSTTRVVSRAGRQKATATARLRNWVFDKALSGDIIVEQNIHVIDVANWYLQSHPLSARGSGGRKARVDVGDCWDHFVVTYAYPEGVLVDFSSAQFTKGFDDLRIRVYGARGTVDSAYDGEASSSEEGAGEQPGHEIQATVRGTSHRFAPATNRSSAGASGGRRPMPAIARRWFEMAQGRASSAARPGTEEKQMPKVVITAQVEDRVQWEKSFRTHGDLFRSRTVTSPIDFGAIEGNQVAVCLAPADLDTFMKILDSPATAEAMAVDGVKRDTVKVFVLDNSLAL